MCKWFIYNQKKQEKEIDFYTYQIELKNRLEIEAMICTQRNSVEHFNEKWKLITDNL